MKTNKPIKQTNQLNRFHNQQTNKTVLLIALSTFLILPSAVFALDFDGSLKEVTITDTSGTNTPPTAVINFTQNGDTVDFDASASADSDGTISEYRWDFGDGSTGTGGLVSHQFGNGSFPITLTVIDDKGAISLSQVVIETTPQIQVSVNFQPASAEVPDGFVADSGLAYDSARGYGWTELPSGTRDRNNSLSPDQSYDTFSFARGVSIWEYDVPNGAYSVTVTVGDPYSPDSALVQNVQVEGVSLIENESLTTATPWINRTITAEVNDNRLTLTFSGTDGTRTQICWVKINSI